MHFFKFNPMILCQAEDLDELYYDLTVIDDADGTIQKAYETLATAISDMKKREYKLRMDEQIGILAGQLSVAESGKEKKEIAYKIFNLERKKGTLEP